MGLLAFSIVAGNAASSPKAIVIPGVENGFQVTDRLFSGGQPEGDAAFAALQKLGVKTLISVDGTKPDLQRAARYGMRYIHLPHGYDGIPTNTFLSLVKAAQSVEGPLFFHCHHGKHRGPAAVGLVCQATAGWTTDQAVDWLKAAGTAADYPGLYLVNTTFRMPDAETLRRVPTNFPARAEVSGLVEAMVLIDRHWDNLKAIQNAGWKAPANQPDLVPAAEGLQLQEAYRELQRLGEARGKGTDFIEQLRRAENIAGELHAFLKSNPAPLRPALNTRVEALAKAAAQSCSSCHTKYRN